MVWATGDALYNGKYILERQLGQGRLGITYLVRDRDDCRWVIKTLNDALLNSLTPQEQNKLETKFCKEALTLKGCNHPHIVKVRELFKEGKRWCIVMDYVDGVSLAYRAQKMLPEAEALNYIQQIGEALIEVHRNGLIHRDVKPGNIILHVRDGKAEAVLIDFDLALEFDCEVTSVRTKEASDGFAPMELYSRLAKKPAEYTDVYSLAATLYELLTGHKPVSAIKRKLDRERLVPPKEYNDQISDRTNRLILQGMGLEPKQRPQSMREWLDSLGLISEASPPEATPPPAKRGLTLEQKLAIAGLIVGVLTLIVTFFGPLSDWMDRLKPRLRTSS